MSFPSLPRVPGIHPAAILTFLLAAALLAMVVAWHIPMMLWDHLDLVPIYRAWQDDALAGSPFWAIHGGHLHTAAYVVLLATTALSDGQPLLDCIVSWLLLLGHAAIVAVIALRDAARHPLPRWWLPLLALLVLHPGHLANLQWGWQVAVFLCLVGVAATIASLTATRLTASRNAVALAATVLAATSFGTGVALVPTALLLIALRGEMSWQRRFTFASPWLAAAVLAAIAFGAGAKGNADAAVVDLVSWGVYAMNFLGAGIARFVPEAAPWLAAAALAVTATLAVRTRFAEALRPWLGFIAFAVVAALLTAMGRAGPFGEEHAFASRYVSFSLLFWVGWLGVVANAMALHAIARSAADARVRLPRWRLVAITVVAALAVVNAVPLMKKAAGIASDARSTAATIVTQYPQVDDQLLREIYFDRPDIARERLDGLRELAFPPFDGAASAVSAPPADAAAVASSAPDR